jgi:hypothetical protein
VVTGSKAPTAYILGVACNVMTAQKLLTNLTLDDLIHQPCWIHYALENIEYVFPARKKEISEADSNNYVVLTEFILNDKTKHLGFCSPQDTSGLDYIQPVIITSRGHLPLYFDTLETIDLSGLTSKILSKKIHEVFPLTYVAKIKCDKKYHKGLVDGFNSLAS